MTALSFPFLSLPDPETTGEGALDPLGFAAAGDRLANWILPGLTARMSRPRFLTAISVASTIADEFEDAIAVDGVTPDYLVFEWLFVEGFARDSRGREVRGVPGIDKARRVVSEGTRMCAQNYLKTPSV